LPMNLVHHSGYDDTKSVRPPGGRQSENRREVASPSRPRMEPAPKRRRSPYAAPPPPEPPA
jgi:hypothetical protein